MKPHSDLIRRLFKHLFERFLEDLEKQRTDSVIFKRFLNGMSEDYVARHQPAEVVRDFVAGMTDQYFLSLCPENLRPGYIPTGD
jgi:dGTPase